MTGGLISITSYGCTDLYLTGAPQITFFKMVYRRYTNFSLESIHVDFDEELKFGEKLEIKPPEIGDCLGRTYLEIELPEVYFTKEDSGITDSLTLTYDTSYDDNYNIVLQFMQLNSQAYRSALSDYAAENSSSTNMLANMRTIFINAANGLSGSSVSIEDSYMALLDSFITAEILKKTRTNINEVCQAADEINLNNILLGLPKVSKDYLMQQVQKTFDNSAKIQEFFFTQKQEYIKYYNDYNSQNLKFAWTKRLGHSIIDYIDVNVNGNRVDRRTGTQMDVWYELSGNKNMEKKYKKMIGDVNELTNFSTDVKPKYKMVIPLQFWFTKKSGLYIPLVAIQNSPITFTIKLKTLEECAHIERKDSNGDISLSDIWEDKGYHLNCNLLVEYAFLEKSERMKFAKSAHEYLIEVTEEHSVVDVSKQELRVKLDFSNPCKELIVVFQKDAYLKNDDPFAIKYHTNYSINPDGTKNIIKSINLDLNGHTRFDERIATGDFLNYLVPHARHRNTPSDGINVMSFALNPEEHQPSSSLNLSKIKSTVLMVKFNLAAFSYKLSDIYPHIVKGSDDDLTMTTTLRGFIWSMKYNIFRAIGGYAGVAYV